VHVPADLQLVGHPLFNARTTGFSFLSKPAFELFMSAVVSQVFVNFMLFNGGGLIVAELAPQDIGATWLYDLSWLVIIDLVKMAIIRIQDGPGEQASLSSTITRNSFHGRRSGSRIVSQGGSAYTRVAGKPTMSKDVRLSLSGMPMASPRSKPAPALI